MQVILSSSSAGQCGSVPVCEPFVPVTDMSLGFHSTAPDAGDEVGMDVEMLVAVPIPQTETIDIGLPGFTASNLKEFEFESATFQTDPAFMNDPPPVPAWKPLGCIHDSMLNR